MIDGIQTLKWGQLIGDRRNRYNTWLEVRNSSCKKLGLNGEIFLKKRLEKYAKKAAFEVKRILEEEETRHDCSSITRCCFRIPWRGTQMVHYGLTRHRMC